MKEGLEMRKETGKEGKEEERGRRNGRADLFSIHDGSRMQIDIDAISVLTNF